MMQSSKSFWREWGPFFLLVFLLFAFRSSFADHYVVPSGSMEPTLQPGDRLAVNKTAYGVELPFTDIEVLPGEAPQAGEVVIFDSPVDGKRLVKRVVAVGGDHVAVRGGRMYLNGVLVGDPNQPVECFSNGCATLELSHGSGPDFGPLIIPAGKLLVMGDSRGNSLDGRVFGLIDRAVVYARAVGVYYRRGEGFAWHRL